MQTLSALKFSCCTFVPFVVSICIVTFAQADRNQTATPLLQPLPAIYQHWLDEDVRWIISSDERKAFEKLTDNKDRDHFIEEFWSRRDPTPGTTENEFKEEHYRRIAYSNEHFAAHVRGSLTDRGRIYILYGPPDAVQRQAINGVPEEIWRYEAFSAPGRFVGYEGKLSRTGNKVVLVFIDECQCNDYRLKTPQPN